MAAPTHPTLAASVAVFRGPRVLLARRGANPGHGLWSLPGGRVEPGETMAEAAIRELMEEVKVVARIIGLAAMLDLIVRDGTGALQSHFVVAAHAGLWQANEPEPGAEALEVGWFLPQEIDRLATTDKLAQVVAKAAAVLAPERHKGQDAL